MFHSPDTHLRVLIIEREIELRRAERQGRLEGTFGPQRRAVKFQLSGIARSVSRRLAGAIRPRQRLERAPSS